MTDLADTVQEVVKAEEEVLRRLEVERRMTAVAGTPSGLRRFAEIFYFVRYDFCRLNFVVGERCGANDFLWKGLAHNLMEELGGGRTPSHNQLYRDFLGFTGILDEETLREPAFARKFNSDWERLCRNAPLNCALAAIGVYEILDNPDYAMLLRVMRSAGVPKAGLRFFGVHAGAEHFEMFEDVVTWLREGAEGREALQEARDFVLATQEEMWTALLANLEVGEGGELFSA